jgi:RNA polymerase sigma factor (sigma-70 family)
MGRRGAEEGISMDEALAVSDLVERCQRGDAEAFDVLYATFSPLVRACGRRFRLSPTDVDDVVQQVWLAFWQSASRLKQPDRIAPWLWVTAANECRRRLRYGRRELAAERVPEGPAPIDTQPDVRALRAADRALVETLLASVRPDERYLIVLLTAERRPDYRGIAARVSRPVGSIGPSRARILSKLRRAVELEGAVA